jgi:hypothetical protein
MISFGSRIADLKRDAVRYVTEKVKISGLYRNQPGDLQIRGDKCFIVYTDGRGTVPLDGIALERIGELADKAHFKPIRYAIEGVSRKEVKNESVQIESQQQEKGEDMTFEIKNNIPLPGQIFTETPKASKKSTGKCVNYRSLPLKDMKVGDCIIIFDDCTKNNLSNRLGNAKCGIRRFVSLMDTKKRFTVAKTDDYKVGVWRVE